MRKWDYNLRGPIKQDETKRYVPQKVGDPLPAPKPLKAVLLAAGKGTRLRPYTDSTPKPLLPLHGQPIMELILDGLLLTGIREVALIVGYKAEMIQEWVKNTYLPNFDSHPQRKDAKIEFIFQQNVNGTGGAVLLAKNWVGQQHCLVTYGDVLMSWSVYDRIVDIFQKNKLDWLLVGNPTDDPSAGAAIYYQDTWISDMIEKPPKTAPKTDLNNAGCYIFPAQIFPLLEKTGLSPRGEIELTAPVIERVKSKISPYLIKMSKEEFWCDVGTVEVYTRMNQDKEWLAKVKNIEEKIVMLPSPKIQEKPKSIPKQKKN